MENIMHKWEEPIGGVEHKNYPITWEDDNGEDHEDTIYVHDDGTLTPADLSKMIGMFINNKRAEWRERNAKYQPYVPEPVYVEISLETEDDSKSENPDDHDAK